MRDISFLNTQARTKSTRSSHWLVLTSTLPIFSIMVSSSGRILSPLPWRFFGSFFLHSEPAIICPNGCSFTRIRDGAAVLTSCWPFHSLSCLVEALFWLTSSISRKLHPTLLSRSPGWWEFIRTASGSWMWKILKRSTPRLWTQKEFRYDNLADIGYPRRNLVWPRQYQPLSFWKQSVKLIFFLFLISANDNALVLLVGRGENASAVLRNLSVYKLVYFRQEELTDSIWQRWRICRGGGVMGHSSTEPRSWSRRNYWNRLQIRLQTHFQSYCRSSAELWRSARQVMRLT